MGGYTGVTPPSARLTSLHSRNSKAAKAAFAWCADVKSIATMSKPSTQRSSGQAGTLRRSDRCFSTLH